MNAHTEMHAEATEDVIRHFHEAFDRCGAEIKRVLCELTSANRSELVRRFYDDISEHSGRYLPHADRRARILKLLEDWLAELFSAESESQIGAVIARQKSIGEVHARINLPPHLLIRGMRVLRRAILERLVHTNLDRNELLEAAEYVSSIMDISRALIVTTFVGDSERIVRMDEAYRLYALGENLQVERERQRAVLAEWAHEVLLSLHRPVLRVMPKLSDSEFGLWFCHKGEAMFEGAPEVAMIADGITRIDEQILPRLAIIPFEAVCDDPQSPVHQLDIEVSSLKYFLNTIFDHHIEIENGRDTLTRLLMRRFVPVVLGREIGIARNSPGRSFAVGLLDLDNFKRINDQYGHDAGDSVLQHVSSIVVNCLRAGDFVFRYGGEEFLVCLTEVNEEEAFKIFDKIRVRIAGEKLSLPNNVVANVRVSIGMAAFDGHPDYQAMISRADQALYQAKNQGRDRVIAL